MYKTKVFLFIAQFLVIFISVSCGEPIVEDTGDPKNLEIELTISEDGSGDISILATADNTVEFEFYVGIDEEPKETNASGSFEYTFLETGNYSIAVRAYGSSGRFIKKEFTVNILVGSAITIEDGYTSPDNYEGYNLVWSDEFEGNSINTANWGFDIGNGQWGWGNNELEYYKSENAWVEDGALTIEARKEYYSGFNYTSAKLKTLNKQSFKYGRIDIRALLPKGQGIWPALWMLGDNLSSVGWPASGEIDIVEMVGGTDGDNKTHGTLHWDSNGHASAGGSYTLSEGIFADEYHVFTLLWTETSMKWYVNDIFFKEITITDSNMTEFHQKFWLIFNVAVGGNWPGSPDATTIFPQQMKVDYVRVFQVK